MVGEDLEVVWGMSVKPILIWMFCLLLAVVNSPANADSYLLVGDEITARDYVGSFDRWIDRQFSIWIKIYLGREYIEFSGETGLGKADVTMIYDQDIQQQLELYIAKGIEWAAIAKQNNADTSKALGCLSRDPYWGCTTGGYASKANQMGVRFFAAFGGSQTELVFDIKDEYNEFLEVTLYFNLSAMRQLERVVIQIPETLQQARKMEKTYQENQDLFQ